MKRLTTTGLSIAVLAPTASPALADPGAPGTTFPELPGSSLQNACTALVSNPGALSGPAFADGVHRHQRPVRRRLLRQLATRRKGVIGAARSE